MKFLQLTLVAAVAVVGNAQTSEGEGPNIFEIAKTLYDLSTKLSMPAVKNVLQSLVYNESAPEPWSETPDCLAPSPFLKSNDDLDAALYQLQQRLNNTVLNYYQTQAGWSIWPGIGSVLNQGNYLDNKTMLTLVRSTAGDDGKYTLDCGYTKGELISPKWGAKTLNPLEAYSKLTENLIPLITGETVTANYYFSFEDCKKLDSLAVYHYDLSLPRTFSNYINDLEMTRTFAGESEEKLNGFVVAAPQDLGKDRFLTALVAMKSANEKDCSTEFMAVFNSNYYSADMADYLSENFPFSDSKDDLKSQIDKCVSQAQSCSG